MAGRVASDKNPESVSPLSGSVALSEFPKIDPLPVASLPCEYATPGVSQNEKCLTRQNLFNMTSVYGMRGVALETSNQGITCNAICPGSVLTPDIDARVQNLMQENQLDREEATMLFLAGKQPTQRFVDSEHIAELLVFLCGQAGRDITGAMLPIEGGWMAS